MILRFWMVIEFFQSSKTTVGSSEDVGFILVWVTVIVRDINSRWILNKTCKNLENTNIFRLFHSQSISFKLDIDSWVTNNKNVLWLKKIQNLSSQTRYQVYRREIAIIDKNRKKYLLPGMTGVISRARQITTLVFSPTQCTINCLCVSFRWFTWNKYHYIIKKENTRKIKDSVNICRHKKKTFSELFHFTECLAFNVREKTKKIYASWVKCINEEKTVDFYYFTMTSVFCLKYISISYQVITYQNQ